MFRTLFVLALSAAAVSVHAQDETPPPLLGSVEGNVYASPTGAFKLEIPVLTALGGTVRDTPNVVTFHDAFGLQITVGAFPQDASQRWELSTRGVKDYLIYFFGGFVMPDFRRFCPGATVESAGFSVDLLDGALFTYVLLPGGSMFAGKPAFGQNEPVPVAKRGNLIFMRNGYVFVVSSELSEKITEGTRYNKTPDEENKILRARLVDIIKKMQFEKAPVAKAP
jgi:hypothetical protein